MASEPNLQAYPEALAPYAKKKPQGTGASHQPVSASPQVRADSLARSLLARSTGPLASPALPGGLWVVVTYVIADLSCVTLTFSVVLMARYAPSWRGYSILGALDVFRSRVPKEYVGVLFLYAAFIVLFSQMYRLYGTPRDRSNTQEVVLVSKALLWSTGMLFAVLYLTGARTISRPVILTSVATNIVALASWRRWKRGIVEQRVAAGIGVRNALIVGAGKIGREIAEYYASNSHLGIVVKGFLDHNHIGDPRVLGTIENLVEICRANFVDELIITIPFMRSQVRRAITQARLNNLDVKIVPDLYGSFARGATLEHVGHLPVMNLCRQPIPAFALILKRTTDILGSIIGLVILSPLFVIIATTIKMDSPGPVFYRSRRVGKKGRPFTFFKFRTMIANAAQTQESLRYLNQRKGLLFKIDNDPRITPFGRFLRKYSLDELPQLWNVLKGDMSLVGPRPPVPSEYQEYKLEHLRRLDVTPGMTGLWQVTARRDPSFHKYIDSDLHYIDGWSIWTDIKILLWTVRAVASGQGE